MIRKLLMLSFAAVSLSAITVISNEDVQFNIDGTIQGLVVDEFTDDLNPNNTAFSNNQAGVVGTNATMFDIKATNNVGKDIGRVTMFLKQARLDFNGRFKMVDYRMKLAFGGEMIPSSSSSVNSILSLLDAYGNVHFFGDALQLRFGQFLVPYSRERLTVETTKQNVDFSMNTIGFDLGRDVGLAVHSKIGLFSGALGVFTGGGIDVPQRYLPEILGLPMLTGRIGINNGLDKDAFTPGHGDADEGIKYAAYLNGAVIYKNSRIGHGSSLGTRYYTAQYGTGLLLNPKWNPLGTSTAYYDTVIFFQYGADAAVKIPVMKDVEVNASAEANYGQFGNAAVGLTMWGGVVDAMITLKTTPLPMIKNVGIGIRYSLLNTPNGAQNAVTTTSSYVTTNAASSNWTVNTSTTTSYVSIPQTLMHEISPVVTFTAFDVKCMFEVNFQRNALVAWEKNNGSYNILLMPNQVSTGNFLIENPVVLRGQMQFTF
ncbi:MAG: porin [Spirochaetota bacterium]